MRSICWSCCAGRLTDVIDGHPGFRTIWRLLCALLTLLILWLALMPSASIPTGLGWDKLNHAAAIAAATGVAYLSLRPRSWAGAVAFLYGASLGVLIEILQGVMATGRAAEWRDVAADLIGAGCVWAVIRICQCRAVPQQ